MITCKICNRQFEKQITNSHLKSHNMTTKEYKERYGELSSPDYKKMLSDNRKGDKNSNYGNKWTDDQKKFVSEKLKGKTPHNKGIKLTSDQLKAHRIAIAKREERYKSGELVRNQYEMTPEIKDKISVGVKQYAVENAEEMSERAKKAVKTRREKGHDLAFFKGRTHSEETKQKIIESTAKAREKNKQETIQRRTNFIIAEGYEILNVEDDYYYQVKCPKCNNVSTVTAQYFVPSKYYEDKGCPSCNLYSSRAEAEIFEYICNLLPNERVISNDRRTIKTENGHSLELDIHIPDKKLAIEYNGLYYHSDAVKEDKNYHKNKLENCLSKGISLISIFEDEWISNKELVKTVIAHKLGCAQKIYARKCTVREIESKEANTFLKRYHLQGSGRSNVRYGLFYNDNLVSVMTFSKDGISRKLQGWEINRFCSSMSVVGGASKLFKAFVKDIDPSEVISYADRRWGEGLVYETLGFEFSHSTVVNYWYFKTQTERKHRYSLRKNESDDQHLTEWENRKKQGWKRIWDCGHNKYIWTSR